MKIFRNFGCDLFYAKSFWYTLRIIYHANILTGVSEKHADRNNVSITVYSKLNVSFYILNCFPTDAVTTVFLFEEGLLATNEI